MHYRLLWPDLTESECYSPSVIIREYFHPETTYPLAEFMRRIREATAIASGRVQAKYGFPCSRALAQLSEIEQTAARFAGQTEARIVMLSFHDSD
jgi:uncharacterized repeat protein (TIGR04042 family)